MDHITFYRSVTMNTYLVQSYLLITYSETVKFILLILHIKLHCWNILQSLRLHLFRQNAPETNSLGNWAKNEIQWFGSVQVPTWLTRSAIITVYNWKPMVSPMSWHKRQATNYLPTGTKVLIWMQMDVCHIFTENILYIYHLFYTLKLMASYL